MKNKKLIYAIIIAIGVIGVAGILILGSVAGKKNDVNLPESTGTFDVSVPTPTVTDDQTSTVSTEVTTAPVTTATVATDVPFNPDDPIGNGDVAPEEIPDNPTVKVINESVKSDVKEPVITTESTVQPEPDKVISEQKSPDEEKPDEVDCEIINDVIIEKTEEAEEKKREEEDQSDKPTIVVDEESTIGDESDKPVSVIEDEEERPAEDDANENGNAPVYVNPAQGGENPFDGSEDSEVDDHNSDEFVGDGGEKPGEGIHF